MHEIEIERLPPDVSQISVIASAESGKILPANLAQAIRRIPVGDETNNFELAIAMLLRSAQVALLPVGVGSHTPGLKPLKSVLSEQSYAFGLAVKSSSIPNALFQDLKRNIDTFLLRM